MRYRPLPALLLLLSATLLAGPAAGAGFAAVGTHITWDTIYTGTRAEAMGQGDLACSTGPLAIFSQPAPLPEGQGSAAAYGRMSYTSFSDIHTTGVRVELGAFRLGFARQDVVSDPMSVRTAYNPEGTGEKFRIDNRLVVLAGSVDVAALLAPGSRYEWTTGFAHRHYRFGGSGDASHADGVDFGSSARRSESFAGGFWQVAVSGSVQNAGQSETVPRLARFGTALTVALDGTAGGEMGRVTIGYVWVDELGSGEYFDAKRYGVELTLLGVASVRFGHDDRTFGGDDPWGLGLATPPGLLGRWQAELDWGRIATGDDLEGIDAPFGMMSLTVGADF